MVGVDYETPMKIALSIAKDATPDSSGKDILKRYRELVAQKSAERMKSQSLSFNNDDQSSLLSSQSSAVESLGSVMSMEKVQEEEQEEDEQAYHRGAHFEDDVTNAIVQEATMIKNHMRESIRDKMMTTHRQQSLKTPAKSRTPSRFKVFQDEGRGADNNTSLNEHETSILKSLKKRSALQPKSTNTNYPESKEQKMKKGINASTLKKPQTKTTTSLTQSAAKNIQAKSKIVAISSPIPGTALKTETEQTIKMEPTKETQPSERLVNRSKMNTNDAHKSNSTKIPSNAEAVTKSTNSSQEQELKLTLKRNAFMEAIKEKVSPIHTKTSSMQQNESHEANQNQMKDSETIEQKSPINHETVEGEEGELLSLGSTASASMVSEGKPSQNSVLRDESKQNDSTELPANEVMTPKAVSSQEIDYKNTTSNGDHTPADSVQTFSIGGRSYSLDVSQNVFKNIFSPPLGKTSPNLVSDQDVENISTDDGDVGSMSSGSVYQDISIKSGDYLSNVVSPTSKAFATGTNDSMLGENGGISKSSAASLIERNKTLIKEVRFADQTCVELSERNAGMKRDVQRLEFQINDLRSNNDSLQEAFVKSKEHSAKLEASNDGLNRQMAEQKIQFEKQIALLENALMEQKNQNQDLIRQLKESNALQLTTEKKLLSSEAKFEALHENHQESQEKVSTLMERLAASQSSAEVSAASAAESYRSFCNDSERRIEELEKLSKERLDMFNHERDLRIQLEKEKNNLIEKYCSSTDKNEKLHLSSPVVLQPKTPKKTLSTGEQYVGNVPVKTPTSTVLARTLEAELQRGHDAIERILEAEMIITVTQSELKETSRQLELAKSEIRHLNEHISQLTKEANKTTEKVACEVEPSITSGPYEYCSDEDSTYDSCSTNELVGKALTQKLTHAKSECEGYKRDLEAILKEISGLQGESFHTTGSQDGSNDQTITGLLQAVRELAHVGSRQANEISRVKIDNGERRKKIEQLKQIVQEREDNISKQESCIEDLKRKIEHISNVCSKQADELKRTQSQMNEISQENQEKAIEIANKEARCDELLDKIRELTLLCNRQSQDLKIMQSDIEKVTRELNEKESQLFAHNYREECFMNEVEDFAARITTMKDKYEPKI